MADRTVILVTHQPPPWPAGPRPARVLALDHGRLTGVDDPVQRAGLAVAP